MQKKKKNPGKIFKSMLFESYNIDSGQELVLSQIIRIGLTVHLQWNVFITTSE